MRRYRVLLHREIKNISFEEALKELEVIVQQLESGQVKLEEAVAAYEKAISLNSLNTEAKRGKERVMKNIR